MDSFEIKESIRQKIYNLPAPFNKPINWLYQFYSKYSPNIKWIPKNVVAIFIFWLKKDQSIKNLNIFENKIYSQNGEDGLIKIIFHKVGITNKFCIEFGVEDGRECNTRYLIEKENWDFLHMDNQENLPETIKKEFVTAENIENLFKKYSVPNEFDLLSIDVDSHDYWIWKAIKNYSPRVVVIEYNSGISPHESKVIKPESKVLDEYPEIIKGGGAGLLALQNLGKEKGYTLIACESRGINAFFIREDLVKDDFHVRSLQEIYYPPKTGPKQKGKFKGFPPPEQALIEV